MRTECKVAALSLALVLNACGKPQEKTARLSDDLKKDLAAASASGKDLAIAPQNYTRMRFVSDIEQSRASVLAKRSRVAPHAERMMATHQTVSNASSLVAPDPIYSMASHQPMTVATPEAAAAQPSIVVATRPAPAPASVTAGGPSSEGAVLDHGGDGGVGAMLGGIIGHVVIRGGRAGDDKCDPRSDARRRGLGADRPDFAMPLPTGQVFGGSQRR